MKKIIIGAVALLLAAPAARAAVTVVNTSGARVTTTNNGKIVEVRVGGRTVRAKPSDDVKIVNGKVFVNGAEKK